LLHFSTPWLLLALPTVLLPLLLYWWKRRQRRRRPFPSLQLVRQTVAEQARRLRLREILLLLLRILVLTCLVLAAAGPVIRADGPLGGAPRRVVVLLDRSLSMTAVDGAGERFERAKGACARYLKLLPGGTRVDLVAFDDRPCLVAESVEPIEALSALGGVEAGLGGTDLAAVLDFVAARLKRLGERGVVALFSDLPAGGITEPLGFEYPLLLYPAGLSVANGGVVELEDLNPLPVAGVELEMSAEATGPPRDFRLYADGEEVALRESVGGGFRLGAVPVEPGWVVYRLAAEPIDAFGVDDVRRLAVLVHPPPRVYTLGDAGLIGTALEAAPGLVEKVTEATGADVILWNAHRALSADEESLLKSLLEGGGGLMMAVPPLEGLSFPRWTGVGSVARRTSQSGFRLGPVLENAVTRPLLGPLSELGRDTIAGSVAVPRLGEDWEVLLRYAGSEPALAARGFGVGRILLWLLPYRLEDGSFAATAAFPPLLFQAVRFCAFGEGEPSSYVAGEVLSLSTSDGGRLVTPDGEGIDLAGGGPLRVELDRMGVWTLESGVGSRPITVNAPGGEGGLAVLGYDDYRLLGSSVTVLSDDALKGGAARGEFPLWRVLLALAGLLLVFELALADASWR
jgi:hypothetical protein